METALGLLRGVAIGIGVMIVALFAFGGPEGIVALVAKADFSDRQAELIEDATAPSADDSASEAGEPEEDFSEDEPVASDDWEAPTIE